MMVFILCRWDAEGQCCFNETARVTREEAEAFIAQQDNPDEWSIDPVDMPLSAQSPRVMAEAVTP